MWFGIRLASPGYDTQWWKNAASKRTVTVITVAANATTAGIDASLRR